MVANTTGEGENAARSDFVRELVQCSLSANLVPSTLSITPPRRVVQFWNDVNRLPQDVHECIESWKMLELQDVELLLLDEGQARDFILRNLDPRHLNAYEKCYHLAMQSGYFRLCYILVKGGCYVDADDVYHGFGAEQIFCDGRLRIQPLCYDCSTDRMIPPAIFAESGANGPGWIFYFNNNPLIAPHGHHVVEKALENATTALELWSGGELPEIQSTTGPGNLTRTIFEICSDDTQMQETIDVLCDWEDIASSKWPLGYRNDKRNWRLSNRQQYHP